MWRRFSICIRRISAVSAVLLACFVWVDRTLEGGMNTHIRSACVRGCNDTVG